MYSIIIPYMGKECMDVHCTDPAVKEPRPAIRRNELERRRVVGMAAA